MKNKNNNKNRPSLLVILVITVFCILGVVLAYWYMSERNEIDSKYNTYQIDYNKNSTNNAVNNSLKKVGKNNE